jgi:hypothetical protein
VWFLHVSTGMAGLEMAAVFQTGEGGLPSGVSLAAQKTIQEWRGNAATSVYALHDR